MTIECKIIKNASIKLKSMAVKKLSPKAGNVNGTTSDKNIVSLSTKKGKSCAIMAKKAGIAKATFKKQDLKIVYTVKVKRHKK